MRVVVAVLVALAAAPAPAPAQVQPRAGDGDPRVQVVDYDPNQVVQLQGAPGYQLTVEFAADEQIETVAVGDSAAWQATANRRGDHLFLKPLQFGASTNLTVVTSVRIYLFDLVGLAGPTYEMAYRVRFAYPGASDAAASEDEEPAVQGRYRLSGSRALRPSAISDNGRHTYIEWPSDRDIPAVYAIDRNGRESLANGMMREGLYVIDGVSERLVFRIDRSVARATRRRVRAAD